MSWHKQVIATIQQSRIPHRNFERCLNELVARIDGCNPGEMIYIYGPTRVGKSMLLKCAMEAMFGTREATDEILPYAIVRAANASRAGQFSTLGLTRRALKAVRHPIHSDSTTISNHRAIRYALSRKSEDDLRDDFVEMLVKRETQYMGFDEMQNIRFVPGGYERASWFLDSLKCAAEDADSVFVILGTYELLPIVGLCPQIIGRSDAIHFPRYKPELDDDISAWEEILNAYSAMIPFKRTSESLRDWNEYLFHGSCGCLGLLDKWLRGAVSTAGHSNSKYLTLSHLQHTSREDREMKVLRRSIIQGESYLTDPSVSSSGEAVAEANIGDGEKPRRKRKPFEKLVKRYTGSERLVG